MKKSKDASPDPASHSRDFLLDLYRHLVLIREFEERVKFLFWEGAMPGTIHQCQGQEATATGVCAALNPDDFITSTFRGHGHALAKGLTVQEMLDELFGATTGCCKGKGPVLLELLTYRRTGHSRRDPCHYQPKDEREEWFSRDPIDRCAETLLTRADISRRDLDAIKSAVDAEITSAIEAAKQAPQPTEADLLTDVFA